MQVGQQKHSMEGETTEAAKIMSTAPREVGTGNQWRDLHVHIKKRRLRRRRRLLNCRRVSTFFQVGQFIFVHVSCKECMAQ